MRKTASLRFLLIALLTAASATKSLAVPSFAESYGTDSYDALGHPATDPYYGSGWDWPTGMAKMPDGGFVVVGQTDLPSLYLEPISGGGGGHTGSYAMGTLIRFAPDGTILWQKVLRQNNDYYDPIYNRLYPAVSSIQQAATDAQGNIFIFGVKNGTPFTYANAPFVAKFSPDGQLLWQNGIDHVTIIPENNPPEDQGFFNAWTWSMGLTNDGGAVISLQVGVYGSWTALAKFSAGGSVDFFKAYYQPATNGYTGAGPVCQSRDGSRYVIVLPSYDPQYSDGATFLVSDSSGNLIAQRRYVPGLQNSNERALALISTADGGFATLSGFYGTGFIAKFNSDLSSQIFREAITVAPGQQVGQLIMQTLTETSDGGMLIGGSAGNQQDLNDPWDALLMKLSSSGSLQFASIFGGPDIEGSQVEPPIGACAIQTSDGGYGLAVASYSYAVSVNGSGVHKPDWWMVKTDTNRQVRGFTGVMIDQPLETYSITTSSQPMQTISDFVPPPGVQYEAITSTEPQILVQDLGSKKLPDQPTLALQAGVPRIISSRSAEAVVTRHFAYHILTAFFPANSTLTFSAIGLPNGFVIDSATGVISGVPPAGSQTTTPIQINLSVTNGTDIATGTLFLTIGNGSPLLTVNGSTDPAYPGSATPVTGLADTALTFVAQQAGAPAGRSMTVEASTTPNVDSSWQRLTNGSEGFMPFDQQSSAFVLGTNNYPRDGAVYFRVRSVTPDRADSFSNIVGPFDLNSSAPRLGKTNLFITHNGPVANIRWGVTEETLASDIQVRIQASKTPTSEGSWYTVGPMDQDTNTPAPNEFYLAMDDFPAGEGIYFRAIASAPGYVDSISAMNGPYTFIYDPAPDVTITIPGVGGTSGQDFDLPITPPASSFNVTGQATTTRTIKGLSLIYDGDTIDHFNGQQGTTQFTTTTMGDHIVEAVANDDLGVIGDAPPVHVRVAPAAPGRILYLIADGSWNNPAIWDDGQGNHAVPGPSDFAVLGHTGVTLTSDVIVGALSINGATINYVGPTPLKITVFHFFTVNGGRIYTDIDVAESATMLMINDTDLQLGGLITNDGRLKVHGKGGISGIPGTTDGLFQAIGRFWNRFVASFHRPAGGRKGSTPHPAPPPSAPPAAEIRPVEVATMTNSGRVISNDGGTLVSEGGAQIVSQGAGNVVSNDGGTLVARRATGLVDKNGNPLISQDGSNLVGKAAIIGENSNGFVGHNGSAIVATGGGNLVRTAAAFSVRGAADRPDDAPAFVQSAGSFDLTGLSISGPVELDGGILSGNGPIIGDVTNNGAVITPGHSAGLIPITGSFAQGSNGTLALEAFGGEKEQFDQVRVGGSATLGGRLNIYTFDNYVPLPNDPFVPLDFNGVSGNFGSVNANVQITPNGVVASLPPMLVPPPSLQLSALKSRKTHGSAGTFDVDLGSGSGSECRSGGISGNYTLVFTFTNPLTDVGSATVTSGTGLVTSSAVDADARQYIVNLTGVTNAQTLNISLTNLQDTYGQTNNLVTGAFNVLIGDVNGDRSVNSGDTIAVRNRSGQSTNSLNFRADANADGTINSGDAAVVRARSGTFLP